jgi:hypothetical protein
MLVLDQLEMHSGARAGIAVHLEVQTKKPEEQGYQHAPAPPATCRFEPRWLHSEVSGRHP